MVNLSQDSLYLIMNIQAYPNLKDSHQIHQDIKWDLMGHQDFTDHQVSMDQKDSMAHKDFMVHKDLMDH